MDFEAEINKLKDAMIVTSAMALRQQKAQERHDREHEAIRSYLLEITAKQARTERNLSEATEKKLVARPFRDFETTTRTVGVCFCCHDCCAYFLAPGDEPCNRGRFIESTAMDSCIHCGDCVDICYFKARTMHDGELVVDHDTCYGCGLCVEVCQPECIEMVERS